LPKTICGAPPDLVGAADARRFTTNVQARIGLMRRSKQQLYLMQLNQKCERLWTLPLIQKSTRPDSIVADFHSTAFLR
jgi:hypothetical protein